MRHTSKLSKKNGMKLKQKTQYLQLNVLKVKEFGRCFTNTHCIVLMMYFFFDPVGSYIHLDMLISEGQI